LHGEGGSQWKGVGRWRRKGGGRAGKEVGLWGHAEDWALIAVGWVEARKKKDASEGHI